MNEDKICPVCGLKMKKLSPQSWECRCGHVEKGKVGREKDRRENKKELKIRFRKGKKRKSRKGPALSHKKVRAFKKKRTSTRG